MISNSYFIYVYQIDLLYKWKKLPAKVATQPTTLLAIKGTFLKGHYRLSFLVIRAFVLFAENGEAETWTIILAA